MAAHESVVARMSIHLGAGPVPPAGPEHELPEGDWEAFGVEYTRMVYDYPARHWYRPPFSAVGFGHALRDIEHFDVAIWLVPQ